MKNDETTTRPACTACGSPNGGVGGTTLSDEPLCDACLTASDLATDDAVDRTIAAKHGVTL